MNKKIIISWILVILWMGVIFWFSSMPSTESNNKSEGTISKIIETTVETTNKVGLTDKHPSQKKMNQVVEYLNYPLRKCMHASVYFILVLLLLNAFRLSNVPLKKAILFSILICFLYACGDEFHQTFVVGRTGQFSDALIDTIGGVIAIIIICIRKKIKEHINTK